MDSATRLKVVRRLLERDGDIIYDAIQRLIAGTCCLPEQGNVCTWDLFSKMEEAYFQHIETEKQWVWPRLSATERRLHESEHDRLSSLLSKARWEFECSYGEDFRPVLQTLSLELKKHLNHETNCQISEPVILPALPSGVLPRLSKLQKRVRKGFAA